MIAFLKHVAYWRESRYWYEGEEVRPAVHRLLECVLVGAIRNYCKTIRLANSGDCWEYKIFS